jgi:hypothetical protein
LTPLAALIDGFFTTFLGRPIASEKKFRFGNYRRVGRLRRRRIRCGTMKGK